MFINIIFSLATEKMANLPYHASVHSPQLSHIFLLPSQSELKWPAN